VTVSNHDATLITLSSPIKSMLFPSSRLSQLAWFNREAAKWSSLRVGA
jgi:hypothetical protein